MLIINLTVAYSINLIELLVIIYTYIKMQYLGLDIRKHNEFVSYEYL